MKRTAALLLALLLAATVPAFFACTGSDTPAPAPDTGERLDFDTEDIYGKPISLAALSDKRVIMINFWEAWCRPCVSEMPTIQALYEKYGDRGFAVVGVYGSSEAADVRETVEKLGITYPVFFNTESLKPYQTQYVPTTVFTDGTGKLLLDEPVIGAQSRDEWEKTITSLLGGE